VILPCFRAAALVGAAGLLLGPATAWSRPPGMAVYGGIYGGYYPGFYSNGFSMYGPPVPTYGPVAGSFGGSDQRFYNYYPGFGLNVPLNRSYPPGGSYRTPPPPLPTGLPSMFYPTPQLTYPAPIVVEVIVPDAAAEVVFDGTATDQAGTSRRFQSPPLPMGKTYQYEVRARWQENGAEQGRTRIIPVQAGQRVVVDFTQAEGLALQPAP
jgi:uncharacterized protein (TIGR03000 family)